jgi:NAD(P)H-dependent FMN reductase
MRPLNIPVVLGTSRKGRMSAHAARFIVDLLNRRAGVQSALVEVSQVPPADRRCRRVDAPDDAPSPMAALHACPACGHQTAVGVIA